MRKANLSLLLGVLLIAQLPAIAQEKDAFNTHRYFDQIRNSREYQAPVTYVVTGVANTYTSSITSVLSKQPPAASGTEAREPWGSCYSTKDPTCDFSKASLNGQGSYGIISNLILPVCTAKSQEDCIESFEIAYGEEKFSPANFLRTLETKHELKPDSDVGFPGGSSISLWNDANIKNSKSMSYLVNVGYEMHYVANQGKFDVVNIGFVIKPYREINGNYKAPYFDTTQKELMHSNPGGALGEIWTEEGKAGVLIDFPSDSKYRLKMRLTNKLAGWYQGRIKDPSIDIQPFSDSNNLVTIEGQPVRVPTFAHTTEYSKLSRLQTQWHSRGTELNTSGFISAMNSDWREIFDYIEYFKPLTGDKTAGSNTLWSVTSTKWISNNYCLTDTRSLVGIVSTNAMGYSGNTPRYSNGSLNYQVAGMHYEPDGKTLVEGTYDLLLRSDAARCLYGFSNAPVRAEISVTGENEQKIAVTSMTESNGWIKLSAYGFNFSSPVIRVKLSQDQAEMPKVDGEQTKIAPPTKAAAKSELRVNRHHLKPLLSRKNRLRALKGKASGRSRGSVQSAPPATRRNSEKFPHLS